MRWLVLIAIAAQFFPLMFTGQVSMVIFAFLGVLQLVVWLLLFVGAVLLLSAQGNNPLLTILCAIVMIAPCANLILLLLINMSVTRTLRRAGLRVGMTGVKDEGVERSINPMLCTGCGYDLTGNISGVCPECGCPVDARQ